MPVQTDKYNFIHYDFNPSYFTQKEKQTNITDSKKVFPNVDQPVTQGELPFRFEGGNLAKGNNKVIITDGIFSENKIKDEYDKKGILSELSEKFNLSMDDIIIIPHEPYEEIMHADGMVRFIDDNQVLVNNYGEYSKRVKDQFSLNFLHNIYGILGQHGLTMIQIPFNPLPYPHKDEDNDNASGYYINYLQVGDIVIIPSFKDDYYDSLALSKFREIFGEKVNQIDCSDICREGGVLNCITWNIFREFNIKEELKKLKILLAHGDDVLIVVYRSTNKYTDINNCVLFNRTLKSFDEPHIIDDYTKFGYWKEATSQDQGEVMKELISVESHIVKKKLIERLLNN